MKYVACNFRVYEVLAERGGIQDSEYLCVIPKRTEAKFKCGKCGKPYRPGDPHATTFRTHCDNC